MTGVCASMRVYDERRKLRVSNSLQLCYLKIINKYCNYVIVCHVTVTAQVERNSDEAHF